MSRMLEKLTTTTCLTAALLGASTSFAFSNVYVLALSDLSPEAVRQVKVNVGKLLEDRAKHGATIVLYDRAHKQVISHAMIADVSHSKHYASRINQVKPMIGKLDRYVAEQTKQLPDLKQRAPSVPTQFFREFSDTMRTLYPKEQITVLLHGAPLQNDPREPSTSMRDGAYPNDESFLTSSIDSVWGTSDRKHGHSNITYHFCYDDGYFLNSSHEEKVHRIWALYLAEQDGSLNSFTADREICFSRFLAGSKSSREFKLKNEGRKPAMLSIKREQINSSTLERVITQSTQLPKLIGSGDAFLRPDVKINTEPAKQTFGRIQVGATWGEDCANCDLDLHVRPTIGAEILSYKNTSSAYGKFHRDWTNSPSASNAHEFIDIDRPVNALGMEIWVSFYSGTHPTGPVGTIRIWIEGYESVFEQEFHIHATNGVVGSVPRDTASWVKLNPASILLLAREGGWR